MKVVIIEDETALAHSLYSNIKVLRPNVELVGITTNIQDSIELLSNRADVDVVFADIRIDDGLSFSIFEKINIKASIVFTTAYDDYVLKALEYNCIDYLLKPVSTTDLERALSKCERASNGLQTSYVQDLASLIWRERTLYRRRLLLDQGQDIIVVKVEDIVYIQSDNGLNKVYLCNGNWGTTDLTLRELSDSLDASKFVRINRQIIVNTECVEKISHGLGRESYVKMMPPYIKERFTLSAIKRKELLSILDK